MVLINFSEIFQNILNLNQDENHDKFHKLTKLCKQIWNSREPVEKFHELLKKEFTPKDNEIFFFYFIEKMGSNPKEFDTTLNKYILTFISDGPSLFFPILI